MLTLRSLHAWTVAATAAAALCAMAAQADEKPAAAGNGQRTHAARHHKHAPTSAPGGTTTRTVQPEAPAPVTSGGTQTGTDGTMPFRRKPH